MGKIVKLWILGLVFGGVIVALIAAGWKDVGHKPDYIGETQSWSKDFPVITRVEVVESGLGDVRGIDLRNDKTVFLLKTNGRVLTYKNGVQGEVDRLPQEGHDPENADFRGMAIDSNRLILAAHGRGSMVARDLGNQDSSILDFTDLTGPAGIAVSGDMLFVTDDRPWPGAGTDTAFDSADYSRWLDKGTQRLFGALRSAHREGREWKPTSIATRLRHPSGVAALDSGRTVYVVESDSAEVRWLVFEQKGADLQRRATLGAVPTGGLTMPAFLGIAAAGGYVFAAGPRSLHIFNGNTAVGRIVFDYPVAGVAARGKDVYLMVGDRLCHFTVP